MCVVYNQYLANVSARNIFFTDIEFICYRLSVVYAALVFRQLDLWIVANTIELEDVLFVG